MFQKPERKPIKAEAAASNASKLLRREDVQHFVRVQLGMLAQQEGIEREQIIACWYAMADANLLDFYETQIEKDGSITLSIKDLEAMPRHQQQNIKKMKVRTEHQPTMVEGEISTMKVQTVEIELIDRRSALEYLAKTARMFSPREDDAVTNLANRIREAVERAQRRTGRIIEGEVP